MIVCAQRKGHGAGEMALAPHDLLVIMLDVARRVFKPVIASLAQLALLREE